MGDNTTNKMTRQIIIVFLSLIDLCLFGQKDTVFVKYGLDDQNGKVHYTTDTVYFETPMRRHILKGTDILTYTHNQQIAKNYGLYLDKVTQSDCQKDATIEFIPTKINSIINNDKEIIVDFNFSENCCYSFLCDIEIVNKSIINLIYYGYGTYCDCDCCHGLTYKILKEDYPDLSKITSVMINGERKTLTLLKKKK